MRSFSVAIVFSLPVLINRPAWQHRLDSAAFRQPPWPDYHPARLAIANDLPRDVLHLAHLIDRLVDQISLAAIVASYHGRGSTPHRPDLMLKAVLFMTQRGMHSPAQWTQQCYENRLVQWLLRGCRPARARWFAFRQRLVPFIDDVNKQVLALAQQQGLLDVQVPVLDGTLLAANSSRHKLINQDTLNRRLVQVEQAIGADTGAQTVAPPATVGEAAAGARRGEAKPDHLDCCPRAQDDAVAPASSPSRSPAQPASTTSRPAAGAAEPAAAHSNSALRPAWLAKTSKGRALQQKRYRQAQQELHKRLVHNAQRRKEDRKPEAQVRISLGDAEATLGLDKEKVYRPLFNVQLVSDLTTDFCLAYGVFSGVQDAATLKPMLGRIDYFLDKKIRRLMTDAGYATGATLRLLEGEPIELIAPWQENDWTKDKKATKKIPKSAFIWDEQKQTYRCPEGHELKYVRTQTKRRGTVEEKHQQYRCPAEHCQNCPRQKECTKNATTGRMVVRNEYEPEVQRHRDRMQGEEAKKLYKKRKEQIERRLADSKEHRNLRKLSMHGLAGANVQVGLTVLANNLVVFDKLENQQQRTRKEPGMVASGSAGRTIPARRQGCGRPERGEPLLGTLDSWNHPRSQFPYRCLDFRPAWSAFRSLKPCPLRI